MNTCVNSKDTHVYVCKLKGTHVSLCKLKSLICSRVNLRHRCVPTQTMELPMCTCVEH